MTFDFHIFPYHRLGLFVMSIYIMLLFFSICTIKNWHFWAYFFRSKVPYLLWFVNSVRISDTSFSTTKKYGVLFYILHTILYMISPNLYPDSFLKSNQTYDLSSNCFFFLYSILVSFTLFYYFYYLKLYFIYITFS